MSNERIEDQISRRPWFRLLVDDVLAQMPARERAQLPTKIGPYTHAITLFAMSNLLLFGERVAEVIAKTYRDSPLAEPFLQDPLRLGPLWLDADGHIISLINARIEVSSSEPQFRYVAAYEFYVVLTGPLVGQRFYDIGRSLSDPKYKPGVIAQWAKQQGTQSKHEDIQSQHELAQKRELLQHELTQKRELLAAYKRRKHERDIQMALLGLSADPVIKIEQEELAKRIEQIMHEIEQLEQALENLGKPVSEQHDLSTFKSDDPIQQYIPLDADIRAYFTEEGILDISRSNIIEPIYETVYAIANSIKINMSFSITLDSLDAIEHELSDVETLSIPSHEDRLRKIDLLGKKGKILERRNLLLDYINVLFKSQLLWRIDGVSESQKWIRSITDQLIDCIQGFSDIILRTKGHNIVTFHNFEYMDSANSTKGVGIDIIHRGSRRIYTYIQLSKEEIEELEQKLKRGRPEVYSIVYLYSAGWDIFELPRTAIFRKAIPALLVYLLKRNIIDNEIETSTILNLREWQIGLH